MFHPGEINVKTNQIIKKSGRAELLFEDEWSEVKKTGRGKNKDVEVKLTIPNDGHFQMRFPKEDANKNIRIFIEEIEGPDANTNT